MQKLNLWLLCVFLVGCVVLPVVDGARGSTGLVARPVGASPSANPITIGEAAIVVCATDVICIAAVTLLAAVIIYAGFDVTDMNLMDVVEDARDWFEGATPGAVQMREQLTAHPYYVDMTADMIYEIGMIWAESGSWTLVQHAGYSAYQRYWNNEYLSMTVDDVVWPYSEVGGNEYEYFSYGVGEGPSGLDVYPGYSYAIRFYAANDCGGSEVLHGYQPDFEASVAAWRVRWPVDDELALIAVPGVSYCMGIEIPAFDAGSGVGYGWLSPYVRLKTVYTDPNPDVVVFTDVPLTAFAVAATYEGIIGNRARTPSAAWYPTLWDGTSDIPLAQGGTGEFIGAIPGAGTTDDPTWWEGLFGGLGGRLTGIWEGIQSIGGTLTDVWELVQALPATMTAAIAAAVVPSESVSARTGTLRDTMMAKAPFAWPVVVFAILGDLFEGGTDCPVIDFGTETVGDWPAVEIEMCVPAGAQSILYTITDVVAAGLVMVWAFWAYRRLVGA